MAEAYDMKLREVSEALYNRTAGRPCDRRSSPVPLEVRHSARRIFPGCGPGRCGNSAEAEIATNGLLSENGVNKRLWIGFGAPAIQIVVCSDGAFSPFLAFSLSIRNGLMKSGLPRDRTRHSEGGRSSTRKDLLV